MEETLHEQGNVKRNRIVRDRALTWNQNLAEENMLAKMVKSRNKK
jgi:hypothetical protein